MHLTPGVVHNFPKAVGVYDFCPLCTKISLKNPSKILQKCTRTSFTPMKRGGEKGFSHSEGGAQKVFG